jgi:hypothetical protein
MMVYHFTKSGYGIDNIDLRRLKISRFNDLNDPFELLAADLLDPRHRFSLQKHKDDFHNKYGMICFSSSWKNPLLWGHYAEYHKGMALGFEVPEELLFKVDYTTERFKVLFDAEKGEVKDGENVIERLLTTKFKDWEYEQEYRLLIPLLNKIPENGIFFEYFSEILVLREVVLGLKSELEPGRVKKLFGEGLEPVRLKKAGMALRKFSVIEDRAARAVLKSSN